VGTRGDKWRVVDELITVVNHVYVPPSSPCLPGLLTVAHDIRHEGVKKTLHRLRTDFHVLGARSAV
jgi:hypothetical protein